MNCVKCHAGTDLHGAASNAAEGNRLSGAENPKCVDCHGTAAQGGDDNPMHQAHDDSLSCQVCHSVTYTNCDGCHVAISEASGNPFFETRATYPAFLIGRNALESDKRPYRFVPVRHVPVAPTSYEYYGRDLLPDFDALPTWTYATPHNIQRITPQNASCDSCHAGDGTFFLTADKVKPGELEANLSIVIESLPPPVTVEMFRSAPAMPWSHLEHVSNACTACHTEGIRNAPISPAGHAAYDDEHCSGCHKLHE